MSPKPMPKAVNATPHSDNKSASQPEFQQLQAALCKVLRDPQNQSYAELTQTISQAEAIEERRLNVYKTLFFNNLHGFFSSLFPVCKQVLGEARWSQLVREFMQCHYAQTPLFHELGEEFLEFLSQSYSPQDTDPSFLLELAHYEWVELALSIAEDEPAPHLPRLPLNQVSLEKAYRLSPLAWLLAYEWPVHQIGEAFQPSIKPVVPTTLLVYRNPPQVNTETGQQTSAELTSESIEFIELAPLLYQWLALFDGQISAQQALQQVAPQAGLQTSELESQAQTTLMQWVDKQLVY